MATRLDKGFGGLGARLAAALAAGLIFAGCGVFPPKSQGPRDDAGAGRESAPREAAVQPAPEGRFQQPGELDRLVDAKPINFPAVKPAAQAGSPVASKPAPEPAAGKGRFRIQVGAENDIDAAQAKKAEYERKLGGTVDVVFDAPYYKLRWGFFETKQDADDKILEIADLNIQGFVVKQ